MRQHLPPVVAQIVLVAAFSIALAAPSLAQNWSFDARTVALGGVGSGSGNIAASMVDKQKPYRSIVVPLGLIQVLQDLDTFKPDDDTFDPVRAAEYAASPIHFIVGRSGSGGPSDLFVTDVLNGELSRDLNAYRGFVPASDLAAEGLANPSWGKLFKFAESSGGFHGIFVGAGPYVSMQAQATVDEKLRTILASDSPVYLRNERIDIPSITTTQLALAVTGGYRARLPLAAGSTPIDGLYLAANYHYLRGMRYESFDSALRLDTDAAGLLTVNPRLPAPLRIIRDSSQEGSGFAIDIGAAVALGRWQFGLGANGLGNRIDWSSGERTLYTLGSLFDGDGEFDDTLVPVGGDVRVELPVDYRAYAAYDTDRWGTTAEWSNGYQGTVFRGRLEWRFDRLALRGGGRFVRDRWEPSGGVGLNLTDNFGVDVAGYGTSANAQRQRHLGIAVSLRFMH